jgi:hypothetical protein
MLDVCLTYADVCLTYADVCWRKLLVLLGFGHVRIDGSVCTGTYADVCLTYA